VRVLLLFFVVATTGFRFANGLIYDDVHVIEIAGVIHQHDRALEVFTHPTMFISTRPAEHAVSVDTYRPIPALSFFVNSMMSGQRLWSYHLTNLLLHALSVQLLFSFLRRWLGPGKLKAAALGATFFAVHPWLAEAHVWINGRSDPFALAFGLGAALLLLRRELRVQRLVFAGLLFFCGLLSKEVLLATLPAFLFIAPNAPWRSRVTRITPLAAATVAYLALRIHVLHGMKTHQDGHTLREASLRGPALVFDALFHLVVPSFPFLRSLRDDFNAVPRALLFVACGALAVGLVVVLYLRTRWPRGPFTTLFFVGSLAPVAGITVILWPGYGRYLYFPAAAVALVFAELVAFAERRLRGQPRTIAAGAIAVYLLVQAALLVSFTTDMGHDETLYLAATERRPNQAYAWGSLGLSYAYAEQDDLAVGALRRAVAIDPNQVLYSGQLSAVLSRARRCDEARPIATSGLERFHGANSSAFHLALALCADSPEKATFHLRRCLVLRPSRIDCATSLERLLTKHEDRARAKAALRNLMEQAPDKAFDEKWSKLASD
jgi:protein O-mannosyl-transferase